MRTTRRRIAGLVAAAALALGSVAFGVAAPASAATCSGTGCNNTLPYATGCTVNSWPIHTYWVGGGKFEMWYSASCDTNWIQWSGPNVCTWKRVQSAYGSWTSWEVDHATWSYSRQIYAPGATAVDVEWAVGSAAYGGGTCDAGAWDYAHEVGLHGWYTIS